MKKSILKALSIAFMMMLIFASCKKNVDDPGTAPGNPVDTTTMRNFQFVIDSLPGESSVQHNISVLVSVVNEQGQAVLHDKLLQVSHDGKYNSASLSLRKGNYKISKFIVLESNAVKFATPFLGSAKAHLVNVPLKLPFFLANDALKKINVQVARVLPADKSEQFGYPQGTFGENSSQDPQNTHFKINIQPLIRIGDVVYDSIPVTLTVVTWDHTGQSANQTLVLNAGTNEITLLNAASKFQFKISKWGTSDELTLLRNQVQPGATYSLGGSASARKLKEELTYRLVNGQYKPETKTSYSYDANGKIQQVLHYGKKPDQSTFLSMTEQFVYAGGRVQLINRYDEANQLESSSAFSYAADGKLIQVIYKQGNNLTAANVSYTGLQGGTGISGDHSIDVQYQFSQLTYSSNLNLTVRGGNVLQTTEATSHGNLITGLYNYDFAINPFVHMGLPDHYFSNYSKHNKTAEFKTYVNTFPESVPYQFSYGYNSEGYPVELVTQFKNYLSQQHSHTIKTIYIY